MINEKNNDTNIQIQYLGSNITSDGRCKIESEESRRASQADICSAGQNPMEEKADVKDKTVGSETPKHPYYCMTGRLKRSTISSELR